MTSGAVNVLIADDHRIVRAGIRQVLAEATDLTLVGETASGAETLSLVATLSKTDPVHVVMLDIAMPDGDGLDVLRELKIHWPGLHVLMLSTYPEKHYAVRCLKLGASGYLNKSADPEIMIAALRKVASGGVYLTQATAEALADTLSKTSREGTEALSHREHQVFRMLISGHSVSDIGAKLGLASNTVSTYRARILEKTGTKNDVELALYAERYAKEAPKG
jgi:two-component system, NarL family, invasion response regulator UvrY